MDNYLREHNASAVTIYDCIFISSDIKKNELLKEIRHAEQILAGMNNEYPDELRALLNEIEAREYILANSKQTSLPRKEIDYVKIGLEDYKNALEKWKEKNGDYSF